MTMPLRRSAKYSDRLLPGFGVIDIEASKWIKFLVGGYYTKEFIDIKNSHGKVTDRMFSKDQLILFEDIHEYADWLFSDEQKHKIIYAHFGGKYDFQFFIKEYFSQPDAYHIDDMIPRGSGLLSLSVSTLMRVKELNIKTAESFVRRSPDGMFVIKNRTISFRDSSAMLPFSLDSLTKNFGVDHKKKEIDYEAMIAVTPEIKEYLEYDLKGLYEVIEKYYEWPMIRSAGHASTMASQALKVFQTYLTKSIPSIYGSNDEFVRSSYFGGRTEIFKPFFRQENEFEILRTYDVNSLYPYVMMVNDYPGKFQKWTMRYDEKAFGFYEVEVEVPEMYVPPLGALFETGSGKRFIFPTGIFRGKWSTVELNYAVSLGVKIRKVFKGIVFYNYGPIFKDYIKDLYEMRQKAPKESVDNVLCKLLMNSTYGRFGLNRSREQIEFEDFQLEAKESLEMQIGDQTIRLIKKATELDTFANVSIAAWVTSHARIHMHKQYMVAPEKLWYTDTDSAFSTHKYPENSKDLGEMKLEYKSKQAVFLLPKTYMADTLAPVWTYFNQTGKEEKDAAGKKLKTSKKVVMKGFDKRKIANFKPEDFESALEGDLKRLKTTNPEKFATFKTAISKNKFLMLLEESPREIRSRYDKRRIYKREYGQVFDSEALHIKDGKIANMDESIARIKKESMKRYRQESKKIKEHRQSR